MSRFLVQLHDQRVEDMRWFDAPPTSDGQGPDYDEFEGAEGYACWLALLYDGAMRVRVLDREAGTTVVAYSVEKRLVRYRAQLGTHELVLPPDVTPESELLGEWKPHRTARR